jgi:hypothetical protein
VSGPGGSERAKVAKDGERSEGKAREGGGNNGEVRTEELGHATAGPSAA